MTKTYPQGDEIPEDAIKILLVEDDETDARLVKIYAGAIPNAQITIEWVKSAKEARAKLEQEDFDLCIFDFWLRTHTSLPLLQTLRAVQETLPIIILSHMTNQHMLEQSIGAGAFYILGKNELNVASLAQAIDSMVFGDGTKQVRLPPAPRQRAEFDTSAQNLAVQLVRVVDTMRDVYRVRSPQADHAAPAPSELESLRDQVSMLRLEWQANLNTQHDPDSPRLDLHDTAELVSHAISAMTPILARQDQHWYFEPPTPALHEVCDAVLVVLMIMEQIYALTDIAPAESVLKFELSKPAGRTQLALSVETKPPRKWLGQSLPQFFCDMESAKGFAFTTDRDERGFACATLQFPSRLN